jgi:hypothetical protein
LGVLGEAGVGLVEALVAALVAGIGVLGLAVLFSIGNTWVVAMGDDRVAVALAQQQIEQIRATAFAPALVCPGNRGCVGNGDDTSADYVAAYREPALVSGKRRFTRLTCVQYVRDDDFGVLADSTPAYAGPDNPDGAACPAGTPTNTLAVTVLVLPAQREATPARLRAWVKPCGTPQCP